jgi:hypothetical protein
MRLPANSKYLSHPGPFQGQEDEGTKLLFRWFPYQPEILKGLPLLPSFLQTALQNLPESVRHIVHRD